MGTNYYLEPAEPVCPTCGSDNSRQLHIGKSSAGWVFAWRGYHDEEYRPDISTPTQWINYLADQLDTGKVIRNEYGDEVSLDELIARVKAKREAGRHGDPYSRGKAEHSEEGDDVLFYEFS